MDPREIAVCERLRQFRDLTGLSRVRFAKLAGIHPLKLSSIEHQRAPLRFDVARSVCQAFDADPIWLANGRGEITSAAGHGEWASDIHPRALLTSVVDTHRIRILAAQTAAVNLAEQMAGHFSRTLAKAESSGVSEVELHSLRLQIARIKMRGGAPPRRPLRTAAVTVGASLKALAREEPIDVGDYVRHHLTNAVTVHTPTTWDSVRQMLREHTSKRGERAKLAAHFEVTRQSVNGWLSGASMPTADIAIRLLHWVIAADAQLKRNPDRASTRPGQMTRTDKSTTNEKAQSDRPEG